jgi:hypothetical protein
MPSVYVYVFSNKNPDHCLFRDTVTYDSHNPDALFQELSANNIWWSWYKLKDVSHRTEFYHRPHNQHADKSGGALYCESQVKKLQATIGERDDVVLEITLWPNGADDNEKRAFLPVANAHSHGFHKANTDDHANRHAEARQLLENLHIQFGQSVKHK